MAQVTEPRASSTAQPNIQDAFLNNARRDRVPVTIHLMDGRHFEARIKNFDKFVVIFDVDGRDHMVFKHAIATIESISHLTPFPRVVLIVLDSVGCGELPDAEAYGDQGSNTLGNIARDDLASNSASSRARARPHRRTWRRRCSRSARRSYGRMAESSAGKDSVTGHWEMMGIVLDEPFRDVSRRLSGRNDRRLRTVASDRRTLGNVVASGTEIIDRLGAEHVRTGRPIVYTSADSVFQIAAHEEVIPVSELYRMCEIAFDLVGADGRRTRHRAPVRGHGRRVSSHGQPSRLRADADRAIRCSTS